MMYGFCLRCFHDKTIDSDENSKKLILTFDLEKKFS